MDHNQQVQGISFHQINSTQENKPQERQGHSSVTYNGILFVFAGRIQGKKRQRQYVGDFWSFDLKNERWNQVEVKKGNSPKPRHNHTAIVYKNGMYVFAGSGYDGYFNDLYRFDFDDYSWSQIPEEGHWPIPRHGHSAILYGDQMIIFGGKESRYYNDIWSFDFNSMKWQIMDSGPVSPSVRCWHSTILYGDLIILFGGFYTDKHENYYNDTFLFDLKFHRWTEIRPDGEPPHPRNRHSVFTLKDDRQFQMILFGGNYYNDKSRKGAFFNDSYLLINDGETWKWKRLENVGKVPCERGHQTINAIEGNIYLLFGGEKKRVRFNDIYTLTTF